jgi:hypothetical protein
MVSYKRRKKSVRKKTKSKRTKHRKVSSTRRKNTSNSKQTWEKFLKNKESRSALKRSWSSKNPQKYYKSTIQKLAKKYSNKK